MKIILSSDEVEDVLESYRATQDPDNAVSLHDIINSPNVNRDFHEVLLDHVTWIMFASEAHKDKSLLHDRPYSTLPFDDEGIFRMEEPLRISFENFTEAFIESIDKIEAIPESCDIVITFKSPNM